MPDKRMTYGEWEALLARAKALGIDTSRYGSTADSIARLRSKVVEREQARTGSEPVTRQHQVKLAGIPNMNACSMRRQIVAREFSRYMLACVNHLSGGDAKPKTPLDVLTLEQLNQAESVAEQIVAATS